MDKISTLLQRILFTDSKPPLMSNRKIKKVNEDYHLVVGFDDGFKSDNHILFTVSRTNGMIDWMDGNFVI